MRLFRKQGHIHDYYWRWEAQGAAWYGEWACACGALAYQLTARSDAELNATLARAFGFGDLTPSAYFKAPTAIPVSA
jgi:hypothetical protein